MTLSRRAVLGVLALAGCGGAAASKRSRTELPNTSTAPTASAPAATRPRSAEPTGAAPADGVTAGPPAIEIVHGSRARPEVALTFHGNGDPVVAEALLRAAEAQSATISIFAVGNWLAANPALGARMLAAGHELANHTFTHPDLGTLSEPAVREEFVKAAEVLQRVSGSNGRYARPSAMDRSTPRVLAAAGQAGYRTVVAFDVDPADYRDPGAAAVTSRTLAAVQPGSIVSLHLGHVGTVQALPAVLDGLASRGLRPVTVARLLT